MKNTKTCGNCKYDDNGCCRFEYIRHDSDYTCEKFEPTVAKNATTTNQVKDKIKLEIDRLIDKAIGWDDDYYNGYRLALEEMLAFIDKM